MKPEEITDQQEHQTDLDVYEQANLVLRDLISDLCEVLEVPHAEKYKRMGYEMIATYNKLPMNTGVVTLIFASVLQDILAKLELTQTSENVSVVRDPYSMIKLEDSTS